METMRQTCYPILLCKNASRAYLMQCCQTLQAPTSCICNLLFGTWGCRHWGQAHWAQPDCQCVVVQGRSTIYTVHQARRVPGAAVHRFQQCKPQPELIAKHCPWVNAFLDHSILLKKTVKHSTTHSLCQSSLFWKCALYISPKDHA